LMTALHHAAGASRLVSAENARRFGAVAPLHLDTRRPSPRAWRARHSWKQSARILEKPRTPWIPTKIPDDHGLLQARDIPFYYAPPTPFTICDAYHCSILRADQSEPAVSCSTGTSSQRRQRGQPGDLQPAGRGQRICPTWRLHKGFACLPRTTYAERRKAPGSTARLSGVLPRRQRARLFRQFSQRASLSTTRSLPYLGCRLPTRRTRRPSRGDIYCRPRRYV